MKLVLRCLVFVGLVAAAGLALLLLFPGLKEGMSQEELPALLGGTVALLLLGLLWWLVCGRSLKLSILGWLVLALPTAIGLSQAGRLVAANLQGLRLASLARIEDYKETPIVWPGFDGPVGLTISFDLVHPDDVSALILPPEIRMGPDLDIPRNELNSTRTGGSGYFKDNYLDRTVGDLTLLKTVLFQHLYVNDSVDQESEKWLSAYHFAPGGRTRLTFHLLPGTIDYLEGPNRLCLSSQSYGIRVCETGEDPKVGCASPNWHHVVDPIYAEGSDVSALWVAAGPADMVADLSPLLTSTLRAKSRLQGDPKGWTAMQKRVEPAGLAAAGYRLCPPGQGSHTAFRTCFCRAAAD